MAFDPLGDAVGVALGAGEDDDGLVAALIEQGQQQVVLLEDIDRVDRVVDGVGGTQTGADVDGDRLAERPAGDAADGVGDRGREEQRLAVLRAVIDDAGDVLDEAHVQHAVDFVHDQHLDGLQVQDLLLMQVEQAARGRDDDIDAFFERLDLGAVAYAAVEERGAGAEVLAVLLEVLVDLDGELARRDEDEAARLAGGRAEQRKGRKGEGGGLAGAGLGGADEILAGHDDRDGLGLDRGRGHVAVFG